MKKFMVFVLLLVVVFGVSAGGKQEEEMPSNTISFLSSFSGHELDILNEMVDVFETKTGYKVNVESTDDLDTLIVTRVESGNIPEVVVLTNFGLINQFTEENILINLSEYLNMNRIKNEFGDGWINLGTVGDKLSAGFIKSAVEGLFFYNRNTFDALGYEIPETWEDLLEIAEKSIKKGIAPFSIGLNDPGWNGWPGTNLLEDIVLNKYGPEIYRKWYKGELKFSSPEIRGAYEELGKIVEREEMLFGGRINSIASGIEDAVNPLFWDVEVIALLNHSATYQVGVIQNRFPELEPGKDFDMFPFPTINPAYKNSIRLGADPIVAFSDSPATIAFVDFMLSAEAQMFWVISGTGMAPNHTVTISEYENPVTRSIAKRLSNCDIVEFDASELMTGELYDAFFASMVDYFANPSELDHILDKLDIIQENIYN